MATTRPTLAWVFGAGNATLSAALLLVVALRQTGALPWALDGWLNGAAVTQATILAISAFGLLRGSAWRFHALRISGLCGAALAAVAAIGLVITAAAGTSELTVALALVLPYLALYPTMQLLWAGAQLAQLARASDTPQRRRRWLASLLRADARAP